MDTSDAAAHRRDTSAPRPRRLARTLAAIGVALVGVFSATAAADLGTPIPADTAHSREGIGN
jgi:hypothetical protein